MLVASRRGEEKGQSQRGPGTVSAPLLDCSRYVHLAGLPGPTPRRDVSPCPQRQQGDAGIAESQQNWAPVSEEKEGRSPERPDKEGEEVLLLQVWDTLRDLQK